MIIKLTLSLSIYNAQCEKKIFMKQIEKELPK